MQTSRNIEFEIKRDKLFDCERNKLNGFFVRYFKRSGFSCKIKIASPNYSFVTVVKVFLLTKQSSYNLISF